MGLSKHWLAVLIIAIGVFGLYWWALGGYFAADDWYHLDPKAQESWAKTFVGDWFWGEQGKGGYYRPLIRVSIVLDRLIYDQRAWGFHLTNLMIHFLCCLLVYFLAFTLLGRKDQALIAGLFFALFPLNHQAVFWISGRTDSLATLFILLSVYLYLLYVIKAKAWWLATSLFSFLLALLSKETSTIVPVLLLLLPILGWQRISQLRPRLKKRQALYHSLWYFLFLFGFLIFRQQILGEMGTHLTYVLTWPHIGETYLTFLAFLALPFRTTPVIFHSLSLYFVVYFLGIIFCSILLSLLSTYRGVLIYLFLGVLITIFPMIGRGVDPWDGGRFLYLPLAGWAIFFSAVWFVIATVFLPTLAGTRTGLSYIINVRTLVIYYIAVGLMLAIFAAKTIEGNKYWLRASDNCRYLVDKSVNAIREKERQVAPKALPRVVILPVAQPLPERYLNPWDTMDQSLRIMGNLNWQLSMGYSSEVTTDSLALMIHPELRLGWRTIEHIEKRVWQGLTLLDWHVGEALKYKKVKASRNNVENPSYREMNDDSTLLFIVGAEGDRGLYSPSLDINSAWHLVVIHFKPITIKRGLIQWRERDKPFSKKQAIVLLNEIYYVADKQEINLGYLDNLAQLRLEPISAPGKFELSKIELYSFFLNP